MSSPRNAKKSTSASVPMVAAAVTAPLAAPKILMRGWSVAPRRRAASA
jgi:hypothetical protein